MARARRYSPEVRERAVRMVFEYEREHSSQWAAILSIAQKIGCTPERYGHVCGGSKSTPGDVVA